MQGCAELEKQSAKALSGKENRRSNAGSSADNDQ
jgi:hypothetical protein